MDQAEEKNGAVIRRFVGHERYSGIVEERVLAQLYQATRVYVNYFQPLFKLLLESREGSKVRRSYRKPASPCDACSGTAAFPKKPQIHSRMSDPELDPVELLHRVRTTQEALAAMSGKSDK